MTRLAEIEAERAAEREGLRQRVLAHLHAEIEAVGGFPVWVFGSLTRPGRFRSSSDVDVAFEALPSGWSLYGLTAWLAERLGRRVDVVLLGESRLRAKIEREGERWTA